MKKVFSLVFFILTMAIFIFELCFSIIGAIDVNNKFAELTARGAGGHEFFGVGADIFVVLVVFVAVVGFIIAAISWKIAQHKAVRAVSGILCPLFLLLIFISVFILMLG